MSVTLSDIAKRAGVSIKTVSRVVNNQGEVSQATRERILKTIQEVGYTPNILARGLVMQRTYTLAVVSWELDKYSPSRFVMGVEREADKQGYSILLTLFRRSKWANPDAVLNSLVSRQVDGIIWHAPRVGSNQSWITPERLAQLPPVVLNGIPNPYLSTVSIDNFHGGYIAVQHLIEQGWRKIGVITGPTEQIMSSERVRAWKACLEDHSLEAGLERVIAGDWTVESGDVAMCQLLDRDPDIDAVFVHNDAMALGAMRCAQLRGRRICEDLGVIGYENYPESAYYLPPLSTVRQDIFELGREAVRAVVRLIDGKIDRSTPELFISKPELVIRQSSLRQTISGLPGQSSAVLPVPV
jgi:LacI family transcriptional regulator